MAGIWLGNNTVPNLTEISDGVLLFLHETDRRFWPSILIVSCIGIPCIVVSTFLALYGESQINPLVFKTALFAFSVVVIGALSYACWVEVATLVETRSRTVVLKYYFLGRPFWVRQFQIHDGDHIAIITGDDEHGSGGIHYVYLCRSRPLHMISAIHLPSIKPSDTLMDAIDKIADRLNIENGGYMRWSGMIAAWHRFLTRKT